MTVALFYFTLHGSCIFIFEYLFNTHIITPSQHHNIHITIEILGHDASSGYIKAVELAVSSSIIHKRTCYLLCSCYLALEHEFRFMLVNQMQRNKSSSSILELCGSLIAVTNMITADMALAMSSHVEKLLDHGSETVRKKAIIAFHRFHQLCSDTVSP